MRSSFVTEALRRGTRLLLRKMKTEPKPHVPLYPYRFNTIEAANDFIVVGDSTGAIKPFYRNNNNEIIINSDYRNAKYEVSVTALK